MLTAAGTRSHPFPIWLSRFAVVEPHPSPPVDNHAQQSSRTWRRQAGVIGAMALGCGRDSRSAPLQFGDRCDRSPSLASRGLREEESQAGGARQRQSSQWTATGDDDKRQKRRPRTSRTETDWQPAAQRVCPPWTSSVSILTTPDDVACDPSGQRAQLDKAGWNQLQFRWTGC